MQLSELQLIANCYLDTFAEDSEDGDRLHDNVYKIINEASKKKGDNFSPDLMTIINEIKNYVIYTVGHTSKTYTLSCGYNFQSFYAEFYGRGTVVCKLTNPYTNFCNTGGEMLYLLLAKHIYVGLLSIENNVPDVQVSKHAIRKVMVDAFTLINKTILRDQNFEYHIELITSMASIVIENARFLIFDTKSNTVMPQENAGPNQLPPVDENSVKDMEGIKLQPVKSSEEYEKNLLTVVDRSSVTTMEDFHKYIENANLVFPERIVTNFLATKFCKFKAHISRSLSYIEDHNIINAIHAVVTLDNMLQQKTGDILCHIDTMLDILQCRINTDNTVGILSDTMVTFDQSDFESKIYTNIIECGSDFSYDEDQWKNLYNEINDTLVEIGNINAAAVYQKIWNKGWLELTFLDEVVTILSERLFQADGSLSLSKNVARKVLDTCRSLLLSIQPITIQYDGIGSLSYEYVLRSFTDSEIPVSSILTDAAWEKFWPLVNALIDIFFVHNEFKSTIEEITNLPLDVFRRLLLTFLPEKFDENEYNDKILPFIYRHMSPDERR